MNKLLILFFFIFFFSQKIYADEKIAIIKNLANTKTLKFNFIQNTNNKEEKGKCIMLFPGNLKCTYQDDELKELDQILNDKSSDTEMKILAEKELETLKQKKILRG